ncbi:MAG: low specificity L-threonine aldolase [Oceanospirillaceae bacterium]
MNTAVTQATALNTNFGSDNTAGASQQILEALINCNQGAAAPYGNDEYSEQVEQRLSEIFECPVSVFIVSTGSAANALSLSLLTPPWGNILCHVDSHINNDECAAPEFFSGAKLVTSTSSSVEDKSSKLDPQQLLAQCSHKNGDVHSTQATCVSISQVTETGSIYTLDEINTIGDICHDKGLKLHMDGARFANALVALDCTPAQMTWKSGVDILSFGASKNGALSAEAIILFDQSYSQELGYRRKRAGHLCSKMRFQAAQLQAYLQDDLWLKNAQQANAMAQRLATGLQAISAVQIQGNVEANIIFCAMPEALFAALQAQGFYFYGGRWGKDICRLVTSFATTTADVDHLIEQCTKLAATV